MVGLFVHFDVSMVIDRGGFIAGNDSYITKIYLPWDI